MHQLFGSYCELNTYNFINSLEAIYTVMYFVFCINTIVFPAWLTPESPVIRYAHAILGQFFTVIILLAF